MIRHYFTALTSGSDDYANELAIEWMEDPDAPYALPSSALPTVVANAALEALASAAREAFGTEAAALDADRDAQGSVGEGDGEEVLSEAVVALLARVNCEVCDV